MSADDKREMRLARLLQALDDCDIEFAGERDDYKARRKELELQLHSLKQDILTGQKSLLDAVDDLDDTLAKDGATATLIDDKGKTLATFGKGKGEAQ